VCGREGGREGGKGGVEEGRGWRKGEGGTGVEGRDMEGREEGRMKWQRMEKRIRGGEVDKGG
jgi:hypothetical protein